MRVTESEQTGVGALMSDITPISIAAHELKSPMVLLRQLSLDLLSSDLPADEQNRMLEQMVQVSERALRLTSDLTRTETLQQSLFECYPLNPLSVTDDVAHELKRLYSTHGRTLRVSRIRNLPPIVANRDLLRRILLNFADNALHYSDINGVVELQAQLLRERDVVRLSVRDYGPSLPLASWKKLLSTLSSKQSVHARPLSSGLGLYISHQFAHAMNGHIGAVRHQDGASFYVELPVSRQMSLV